MNWAPCHKCAAILIDFYRICDKGEIFFTGLYTTRNQEETLLNYKGWQKLGECVTLRYMKKPNFKRLNIEPPIKVKTNIQEHSKYARRNKPADEREHFDTFCKQIEGKGTKVV